LNPCFMKYRQYGIVTYMIAIIQVRYPDRDNGFKGKLLRQFNLYSRHFKGLQ